MQRYVYPLAAIPIRPMLQFYILLTRAWVMRVNSTRKARLGAFANIMSSKKIAIPSFSVGSCWRVARCDECEYRQIWENGRTQEEVWDGVSGRTKSHDYNWGREVNDLPLKSGIVSFTDFVTRLADKSVKTLECSPHSTEAFQGLCEAILTLTIARNWKRAADVEYCLVEDCTRSRTSCHRQEEILKALAKEELILYENAKRVTTRGKER